MNDLLDVEPVLDDWLTEGVDVWPDRSVDAVLAAIQRTSQRRAWRTPWRIPTMDAYQRTAIAAGLVLAVGAGAILLGRSSPAEVAAPASPSSTSSPIASAGDGGPLPIPLSVGTRAAGPGRYRIDALIPGRSIALTLPVGWRFDERNADPWQFIRSGPGTVEWFGLQRPTSFNPDPCSDRPTSQPVGPSIGDIAGALAQVKGFSSSPITDVTIAGRPAKALTITATDPACRSDTVYPLWDGGYTKGGQYDRIVLIDVDGRPLLIHVRLDSSVPRPDIDAIIGSITIGDR